MVDEYGTKANAAEASARQRTEKAGAQNDALSSTEAKGAIEAKLKSEPGLESKVQRTGFLRCGALDYRGCRDRDIMQIKYFSRDCRATLQSRRICAPLAR